MEVLNEYDTISVDTLALEEILREERAAEISKLNTLSKKVCYLHTELLYYRHAKSKIGAACYEAWKTLVKKVGGTPNCWRDLGRLLGVTQDDLDYIMNSVRDDPVDMVLKVFKQNEKATLDKVVDAFVKMKRYDILKSIEDPLCSMAQYFNKDDSGYQSNDKMSGHKEIVTLKCLSNDLPPALNKSIVSKDKDPNKPKPQLQPSQNKNVTVINDSPILFLTYAQDGLPTAINIQEYVSNWSEITGVKVVTLNNRREDIYKNPEKFIREYFEKVSFLVTYYLSDIIFFIDLCFIKQLGYLLYN
ncbi:hypothetical protein O3G_MSEX001402 [Manduca sexta]|uniref:Death domain-containing protein n=1 Tax=Manduca sexta TaxID=7130 RepID=A0A921YJY6_MANSE|nr:hypothetical protein O3G_MSEX001402 [Manduca sexta]